MTFDSVVRAVEVTVADATRIMDARSRERARRPRLEWATATDRGPRTGPHRPGRRAERSGEATGDDAIPPDLASSEFIAPEMGGDIGAFLTQSLLPLLLGVWSGSMIGQLAYHAARPVRPAAPAARSADPTVPGAQRRGLR